MSDCVLESAQGAAERESLYAFVRDSGSKMPPIHSQFCEFHGLAHPVEAPNELSSVPVVVIPQEALEPIKWKRRPYCNDCASYHDGACQNPGRAVTLGVEQWEKKEISL